MSQSFGKIKLAFSLVLFLALVSIAFGFTHSVQAQSVQVSLCATQAGTTCLTFSGNTPALTAWLDDNVNGIKWPAIVDNNFTISLYENPNYGGQCWSYTSRSNSVTPVPYEVAGKISSLKLGPCASTAPSPTPAPGGGNGTNNSGNTDFSLEPYGPRDFSELVNIIIKWIFNLAIPVAVIMIIYSGVMMLTDGGSGTRYKKGKDTLKYAVIGLVIIFIGKGFISLIKSILELRP